MSSEQTFEHELASLQRQLPREARAAMQRVLNTVAGELKRMDRARYQTLGGMTDAELLAELARRTIEHQPLRQARQARMRLKGAQRFAVLVERHGGSYTVGEVAALIGTSKAAVCKALNRHQLVAFKHHGEWRLPVWQFGADDKPLAGLSRVLKALPSDISERDIIRFLLLRPEGDPGASPLELLLSNTEADLARAERLAQRYLEQIAA